MASASAKHGSIRKLSDLLDEQQEPFVLEIYLLERGYKVKRSLEFESANIGCCSSSNHGYYKNKKKSIPNMAKTLLSKLVLKKPGKRRDKGFGAAGGGGDCCSSVSCSLSLSNTTDHDDVEDKQCSPNSVLDEIDLLQGIPVYNAKQREEQNTAETGLRYPKKASEDAILSASLWELLMHFRRQKPKLKHQGRRKPFPEYMDSKKVMQKDRQLLFDCVREAVENGKQLKNSISSREKCLKNAEVGKFICKNLKVLTKRSADKTSIQKVLRNDLYEKGVADEWGGFEELKKEIVAEIGDGIVDDITDAIISDMSIQY